MLSNQQPSVSGTNSAFQNRTSGTSEPAAPQVFSDPDRDWGNVETTALVSSVAADNPNLQSLDVAIPKAT